MTEPITSRIDAATRAGVARIMDVLLPGEGRLPRATDVDAHGELLDRVLRADPTLIPIVQEAGAHASTAETLTFTDIEAQAGDDGERLVFALHAAYYMSSEVRARLGYPGQKPVPLTAATPDQVTSDELLAPVIARGRFHLPTPTTD